MRKIALAAILAAFTIMPGTALAQSLKRVDCSAFRKQPDGSYLVLKDTSIVDVRDNTVHIGKGDVIGPRSIMLNGWSARDLIDKKCATAAPKQAKVNRPATKKARSGMPTPPPVASAPVFFYNDGGKPAGPLSLASLRAKVASGTIKPSTLVWKSGTPRWVEAKNLAALSASFNPSSTRGRSGAANRTGANTMPCERQPGKVFYQDTFADTNGGWGPSEKAAVKSGAFRVTLTPPQATYESNQNVARKPTEADYCLDVILPKVTAPDMIVGAGLELLGTNQANFYMVQVSSNGHIGLYRRVSEHFHMIFGVDNSPAVKVRPGAINSIRVVAKSGHLTAFVNGTRITTQPARMAAAKARFGFYSQVDGTPATRNVVFRFEDYRITALK